MRTLLNNVFGRLSLPRLVEVEGEGVTNHVHRRVIQVVLLNNEKSIEKQAKAQHQQKLYLHHLRSGHVGSDALVGLGIVHPVLRDELEEILEAIGLEPTEERGRDSLTRSRGDLRSA